jgi:aryl carrier-like protein
MEVFKDLITLVGRLKAGAADLQMAKLRSNTTTSDWLS